MESFLTKEDRENYTEWCALISGYSVSCYEKMNDEELQKEYQSLSGTQTET